MRALFLPFLLLVVGCASTQSTLQSVNSSYLGKNADEFFIKHGPPMSSFQLDQGGVIYKWQSDVKNYSMPATTTHHGTATGYGYTGTSTTTGGGTMSVYTTLQIEVNEDNRITRIKILKDTIGKWELSRFNEIFGEYSKPAATPLGSKKGN